MKNLKLITALFLVLQGLVSLQAQAPSFQDFLHQFPSATLPYSFDTATLKEQIEKHPAAKAKRLDWEFYQFLPELERSAQFSSKPVHPEPVAVFETDKFYAVLYNVARGLTRGAKTYSVSVFEKNGNYIGTHFVAGVDPQHLTVATIDEHLKARVQEYNISWENEYEFDNTSNKVNNLLPQNMQFLELTEPGNPDPIEWTARMTPKQTEMSADIAKWK
jgi:hypothetical protein